MCTMGEVLSPLLIQGITEKNELKNLSTLKKNKTNSTKR